MAAMTRYQWSMAFVRTLGNMAPAPNTLDLVQAWGVEEGGGGSLITGSTNSCNGNMLNTEYRTATSQNCAGAVQSFASNNDGIYANAMALRSGYPSLLQALVTNDSNALGYNGNHMSQGVAEDLSYWVSGNRTSRFDYAAKVASLAGAQGPANVPSSSTSGGTPVAGSTPSSSSGSSGSSTPGFSLTNPATWLPAIIGQNASNWIQNPTRILKMVAGIVCIGIALFLLAAPAENAITQAVAPIAKSAALFA